MKVPQVGDPVYIPPARRCSGGLARVRSVSFDPVLRIHRLTFVNLSLAVQAWERNLELRQKDLKRKFGNQPNRIF